MGLARGNGRVFGIRGKGRGGVMKPLPPLMGRLAPPPLDMMRPRGMPPVPHPGLMPRMRPPPPGMRSPRPLPPPPGPRRPHMPPFMPPPPPVGPHSFPPGIPRPPMLRGRLGQRLPPPGLRPPRPSLGIVPPMGPMGRIGRGGKRIGMVPNKGKAGPKTKKTNPGELQENELNKPWITEAMKNEIMKKHKLYQKAKKSNDENDWKEFKEQKTRVATMIREAKLEYIGSHPEEEKNHYCETCDREFKNASKLTEHVEEHRVCGLDGCKFFAHPKIIEKHVKMQHDTGLFKKIGNIYTPEELAKWIADRKRLYPTKENVEKKRAEREERTQRGERLDDKKDRFGRNSFTRGRMGTGLRGKSRGYVRGRSRGGFRNFCRREFGISADSKRITHSEDSSAETSKKIPSFPGTGAFMVEEATDSDKGEEEKIEFSDSEWEAGSDSIVKNTPEVKIPHVSNALSSLINMYASDASDSQEEYEETKPVTEQKLLPAKSTDVVETKACTLPGTSTCASEFPVKEDKVDENDSGPEEAPVLRHTTEETNSVIDMHKTDMNKSSSESTHSRKRRRHHRSNGKAAKINSEPTGSSKPNILETVKEKSFKKPNFIRQKKLTLLEKLLSSEIRHERNVTLQCVRYTVQNKFFDRSDLSNSEKKASIILQCIRHLVGQNLNSCSPNLNNIIVEETKSENVLTA